MPLVLIVEDDEETLRMMRVLLTSWGYDAACARNGAEALEQMRQQRPCLVLLDMHMPVMGGSEFRRRQLAEPELASVPILCLTAHYEPEQVTAQIGAPCIRKPPDFRAIIDAVKERCGPVSSGEKSRT